MALLPLPPGERLVGDLAQQILKEGVLAPFGRAWIRLARQHLLADERVQQRLHLLLGQTVERGERLLREALAEHGGVLEQGPLLAVEAVQARRDQGLERLRDLER